MQIELTNIIAIWYVVLIIVDVFIDVQTAVAYTLSRFYIAVRTPPEIQNFGFWEKSIKKDVVHHLELCFRI